MQDILTEQFNLWTASPQHLALWECTVEPAWQELDALLSGLPNYLALEVRCNAFAAACEREGFAAGFAWAQSLWSASLL